MTTQRSRHGYHGTRIYRIWGAMKRRCQNKNQPQYAAYGGRGIKVCDTWQQFLPFLEWANVNGYTDGLTLDRLDPNGNYEPSNCRWASYQEQGKNRKNAVTVTAFGETKRLTDWLKDLRVVVHPDTVRNRLANGMSPERAFTMPKTRDKHRKVSEVQLDLEQLRLMYESGSSVREIARELGVPLGMVKAPLMAIGAELGDRAGREDAKIAGYTSLPYVTAVLGRGMTTRQAAAAFGVSQTIVAQKVAAVKRSGTVGGTDPQQRQLPSHPLSPSQSPTSQPNRSE